MGSESPSRVTFYLVVREGTEAEQVVVWDTVDVTLGRHDGSDIVIDDGEVSRNHSRFQRRGEECFVEDLGTGLGTFVGGKRITRHPLQHGDVVAIGPVEIRFGRTTGTIKRSSKVSYASELKEFGLVASGDAAGQTMLAFDTEDDIPKSIPAPAAPEVRAVTADGQVDLADPDSTAMEIGLPDAEFGNVAPVRDLDRELGELPLVPVEPPAGPEDASSTAPTLANLDQQARGAAPVAGSTVKVVLEVEGPPDKVEEFLSAVRDKRISVPPLTLLVRDL